MTTFNEMDLPESLKHKLQSMEFFEPTPVQAKAIPLVMQGHDILGSAQTGTGKTGAFGIPIVAKLLSDPHGSTLIITPTRELATQVMSHLKSMCGGSARINSALLIGGESMFKQLDKLRNSPRIIVGTPGRINDHLDRGSLVLSDVKFLVLDETDRMLDMGFSIQIDSIIKYMPPKHQTLLFSATFPKAAIRIAEKYLKDPVSVTFNAESAPAANITQDIMHISADSKYSNLLSQLDDRQGSIIVFVNTKHGTEKIATKLSKEGHSVSAIHGDLRQNKRDRVIKAFRNKKCRILVATDVASRGLDIDHIEHVINYDLPQCAEDYIHRIGRTARAGAEGCALNLITPADKNKWNAIDRLLNPDNYKSHSKQAPGRKTSSKRSRDDMRRGKKRNDNFSNKYKDDKRSASKKVNRYVNA